MKKSGCKQLIYKRFALNFVGKHFDASLNKTSTDLLNRQSVTYTRQTPCFLLLYKAKTFSQSPIPNPSL
ncbi:hypothetical protein QVD17_27394 [Tagetes erecta]|uniref:Uncharacterized protein n=1 Tax=Tagetes erecta TaxID=13708 RepID=A0AAD8KB56_TARER|nr:hypothetical protein QVD17_27394 [Tagetes erecta]